MPEYKEIPNKNTKPKYPVENVQLHTGYDYIVISAARTLPSVGVKQSLKNFGKSVLTSVLVDEGYTEEFAEDIGLGYVMPFTKESKGNQYRFINHGLRQLRFFPEPSVDNDRLQRIHVVFKQGYTPNDIKRIDEYTSFHKAQIVYVNSVSELIEFLNGRKEKNRLVKELIFYSHGLVSTMTFHYKGENVEVGLLGLWNYNSILEEIFDFDAKIVSYGCRNGISMEGDDFPDGEAGQEHSLAQKMADDFWVDVYAFEKRSIYTNSYGDRSKGDDAKAAKYGAVVETYRHKLENYEKSISMGFDVDEPKEPEDYHEGLFA